MSKSGHTEQDRHLAFLYNQIGPFVTSTVIKALGKDEHMVDCVHQETDYIVPIQKLESLLYLACLGVASNR